MKILNTGKASAKRNMEIDQELLRTSTAPTLHLYDWERPSVTYGYFIKPNDYLTNTDSLDLARRPTGGGILFHTHDLAFSVILPTFSQNTLENYAFINTAVAKALARFTAKEPTLLQQADANSPFCMATPTIYDIVLNGKKVGGAAQRKTKKNLLHQGSISLAMPPEAFLKKHLKQADAVIAQMRTTSYLLAETQEEKQKLTALLTEEIRSLPWNSTS